ncbi:MAG: heavy-metal-associated domain-containing protein [Phycisphaerales bacterium]|nr:heavy-metal-associated domain-containing protein [Phycisphaerales bacterium]
MTLHGGLRFRLVGLGLLALAAGCEPPTPPASASLIIDGMHCDDCAKSIHHAVTGVAGVESCEVSFADGEATIQADSAESLDAAIDRIRSLGFMADRAGPADPS